VAGRLMRTALHHSFELILVALVIWVAFTVAAPAAETAKGRAPCLAAQTLAPMHHLWRAS
jgi:hypothetical protein